MSHPRETLRQLLERRDLTESQAEELLTHLTDPSLPAAMAGAMLAALRAKGVIADEVRGFAQAMRRLARRPDLPPDLRAIDIVGTGGDASGSLNISTGTALLTAACGLPVIKHGNRSISSRCGSADVLEALGLALPLDAQAAADCLAATGFTFLFAPHYHPATKAIAPVRAALGVRTVFNILGPLVNPAEPPLHLIGAFSLEVARLIAETLQGLPLERAFVVHGADGWDEPTPDRPVHAVRRAPGRIVTSVRTPADYGLSRCAARRTWPAAMPPTMRGRCAAVLERRGARRAPRLPAARGGAGARSGRRGPRATRGRGARRGRHRQRRGGTGARGTAPRRAHHERRIPGGDGAGQPRTGARGAGAAQRRGARARAQSAAAAPRLRLDPAGFDLIAELKLRSPAAGALRGPAEDVPARVGAYARAAPRRSRCSPSHSASTARSSTCTAPPGPSPRPACRPCARTSSSIPTRCSRRARPAPAAC